MKRFSIIAGLLVLVALSAFALAYDRYPGRASQALAGDLRKVTFLPQMGRSNITVTNAALLDEIRYAIFSAHKVPLGSYPGTVCTMKFGFHDGRTEEFQISASGISGMRLEAGENESYGQSYIMIKWRGYLRQCGAEPFHSAIRAWHREKS